MKKLSLLLFIAILSINTFAAEEAATGSTETSKSESVSEIVESAKAYLAENGMELLLNLLASAAIFFIGRWVARLVAGLIKKMMDKANVDPALGKFVKSLVYNVLLVFVIIAALAGLGVQTGSFIAIIGAAGLAVGLALGGTLSNFASGVLLIIFKPFTVGDFIEAGGAMGVIKEIQIFNTILNTPDNKKVIVPNAQVTGGNIVNYSVNGTRRVDLVIGVSYEDDLKIARQVLESVLQADTRILSDPAYTVAVSELGDSSVSFVVRPWVKSEDYWGVYFDLTEKIKVALEENGLSIPFPQRDVHLFNTPSA
jgi:small conductance mechanosensitive channel